MDDCRHQLGRRHRAIDRDVVGGQQISHNLSGSYSVGPDSRLWTWRISKRILIICQQSVDKLALTLDDSTICAHLRVAVVLDGHRAWSSAEAGAQSVEASVRGARSADVGLAAIERVAVGRVDCPHLPIQKCVQLL